MVFVCEQFSMSLFFPRASENECLDKLKWHRWPFCNYCFSIKEKTCMRCVIKPSPACVNCFQFVHRRERGIRPSARRQRLKLCKYSTWTLLWLLFIFLWKYTVQRGARGVMTVGKFEPRIKFRQEGCRAVISVSLVCFHIFIVYQELWLTTYTSLFNYSSCMMKVFLVCSVCVCAHVFVTTMTFCPLNQAHKGEPCVMVKPVL